MAVQTGQTQGQASSFATNTGAAGQASETLNSSSTGGNGGLFDFTQGLHSLPVSATVGGQSIRDFQKVWDEMQKADTAWDMVLLNLDRTNEPGWFASAIVAVVWAKEEAARSNGNPIKVAVYPMLLANTEKRQLSSFMVKINDLEYPVNEVPSMAMNEQFTTRINEMVADHFGKPVSIINVPGMVVHKEVDLTKADQVRPLIENAARAGVTAIAQTMPNFVDANLSKLQPGSVQTMKIESNAQPRYDITGMPIRSDFLMTFSDRQPGNRQQTAADRRSLNDVSGQETVWASMSAFIDLVYNPVPQAMFAHGMDPAAQTRVFVPRTVVTDIHHNQLATVASTMMMLATTTALAAPQVWLGQLYQRMKNYSIHLEGKGKDKFDPTDIGVLNTIARAFQMNGEAAHFDLKSNDVTTDVFVDFAQKVFVPQMHVAVDVPHAGPQSFFMGLISAAANNDRNALLAFVGYMDKLTGGLFTKRFLNGDISKLSAATFFSETNNTTPAGYAYQKGPDDNLVKVDLRQVDYLYVANRFKNDPTTLKKWAQSFLVGEVDAAKRLGQRMDVLNACFTNVTVNGYFERHTFRADFLVSLFNCMVELGIKPELKYIDPLRDASSGENAPAFVRTQGLQQGMLSSGGFTAAGGLSSSGLGSGGLGNGGLGRWG